ncbi:MAG: radical SAM protein [Armatimonadota bacterium]|nr:MAG: radical SAM protein [Armatimonadota bacterium]
MTQRHERERGGGLPPPRIVAWEITGRCDLACKHCRAAATAEADPQELTPDEALAVVEQLAEAGTRLLILTGGDPLLRPDWPDLAARATAAGIRVTMAPNGLHVDAEVAARMRECGIERAAISLDFPTAELHDEFRGVPGAFDAAVRALRLLREAGVECQVNTTISALNVNHLDALIDLALELGAVAFHPFLLVETGRGEALAEQRLTPEQCEEMMLHVRRRAVELQDRLAIKPTDMPHYCRVAAQNPAERGTASAPALDAMTRGCLAGRAFCFISSRGDVCPCGYLPLPAGSVRVTPLARIWRDSAVLRALRDDDMIEGKCGRCEFKRICGGCRARAFAHTGDFMAEEPLCAYLPKAARPSGRDSSSLQGEAGSG